MIPTVRSFCANPTPSPVPPTPIPWEMHEARELIQRAISRTQNLSNASEERSAYCLFGFMLALSSLKPLESPNTYFLDSPPRNYQENDLLEMVQSIFEDLPEEVFRMIDGVSDSSPLSFKEQRLREFRESYLPGLLDESYGAALLECCWKAFLKIEKKQSCPVMHATLDMLYARYLYLQTKNAEDQRHFEGAVQTLRRTVFPSPRRSSYDLDISYALRLLDRLKPLIDQLGV